MAGAPEGNNNAGKGREWRDALRYELARIGREVDGDDPAYRKGLRECAKQFVEAARLGEPWALKELGDREDGKPNQSISVEAEITDVSGLTAAYGALLASTQPEEDSGETG